MGRVLLVDDRPATLETAARILRCVGFCVTTVVTGAEAISKAHSEPFDVILIDLRLPDISGTEVVRHVRSLGVRAALVIVTAFPSLDSAYDAGAVGADGFIDGWLLPEELVEVVTRAEAGERPVRRPTLATGTNESDAAIDAVEGVDVRVRQVMRMVAANVSGPESVVELAQRVGLSASGLRHLFRSSTGLSVTSFRTERRLEVVRQRLATGTEDVRQIALDAGYGLGSLREFRKLFRRRFGMSPREYRRRCRLP